MNLELTTILQVAGGVGTAVGLWYKDVILQRVGIKKAKTEVEATALGNVQHNLDIYQEMIDDLDKRYKGLLKEVEANFTKSVVRLNEDIEELRTVNKYLNDFVESQKKIILKINKRLDFYIKKYGEQ